MADTSYSVPIKVSAVTKAYFEFDAGTPVLVFLHRRATIISYLMIVALADLMLGVDVAASSGVTTGCQVWSSIDSHVDVWSGQHA